MCCVLIPIYCCSNQSNTKFSVSTCHVTLIACIFPAIVPFYLEDLNSYITIFCGFGFYVLGSFAGLSFLAWYLSGKFRAFDRRGHVAKLCIVFLPILLAALVGVSRVDDYWHHWQDVFAGGLLGECKHNLFVWSFTLLFTTCLCLFTCLCPPVLCRNYSCFLLLLAILSTTIWHRRYLLWSFYTLSLIRTVWFSACIIFSYVQFQLKYLQSHDDTCIWKSRRKSLDPEEVIGNCNVNCVLSLYIFVS